MNRVHALWRGRLYALAAVVVVTSLFVAAFRVITARDDGAAEHRPARGGYVAPDAPQGTPQLGRALAMVRKNPRSATWRCRLGLGYYSCGDYGHARDELRGAVALAGPSRLPIAYYYLGLTFNALHDPAQARATFARLLTVKQTREQLSDDYLCLGNDDADLGRIGAAVADYNKALRYGPKQSGALCGLGMIAARRGQFAQARDYLTLAAQSAKTSHQAALAHGALGEVYQHLGDSARAQAELALADRLISERKAGGPDGRRTNAETGR
jgi:tetratricopeptide (TPR) repeat protein